MTRNLQRIFVVLPSGAVRQGALFEHDLHRRVYKVHLQGFRRPLWLPEVDVFRSRVDAIAERECRRPAS